MMIEQQLATVNGVTATVPPYDLDAPNYNCDWCRCVLLLANQVIGGGVSDSPACLIGWTTFPAWQHD